MAVSRGSARLPGIYSGSNRSSQTFKIDAHPVQAAGEAVGIVSKRLRRERSPIWVKVKNPKAPAVKREAEEDWSR